MLHAAPRPRLPSLPISLALLLVATVLVPGTVGAGEDEKRPVEVESADDLLIVDCLLPQKTRRLGRRSTFLAPRKPIRTTAVDCRIRGGEYTEPDQASYATALEVWLPRARAGDPEAQFYVGQIYERGLGTEADYGSAAEWYADAADQGYTPAQVALAYLYEEGLGVERDEVKALNLYREAAGVAEDLVVLEASQVEAVRQSLEAKEQEVRELRAQVEELRRQLDAAAVSTEAEKARRETLQGLVERLEEDLAARRAEAEDRRERLAELESALARGRSPAAVAAVAAETDDEGEGAALLADLRRLAGGEYHALVIGNSRYRDLPTLEGADDDARRFAEVLETRYGFDVDLLIDADRFSILTRLDELRKSLEPRDRLVVYYAGHGRRDATGPDAWWQPVDADPENPANWIASSLISQHLDLIAANHVLLVANAVFGGLRTRSSVARLPAGLSAEERKRHVRLLMDRRARLVLTADDAEGEPDDAFADALVAALEANEGVLEASQLYEDVNRRLYEAGGDPSRLELATLRWARNDLADFFFLPE